MRSGLKKYFRRFLIASLVLVAMSVGINGFILYTARNDVQFRIQDIPAWPVALVLGTEPVRPDGSANPHFVNRTDAAAALFLAGKAKKVLISGSKNNRGFNEVLEMKKRILASQVPAAALVLDFDGRRTFESIRRAKNIYHLQKIILVTNAFHAPRALFYCRHFGMDAVAFCPGKEPTDWWYVHYQIREYFARLKAVEDVLADRILQPK